MSISRNNFNFNLEALRGLAALVVVWHHIIVHQRQLDPAYTPNGAFAYNAPGHFAVLIFFLLSGYVIGVAYVKPLQLNEARKYLSKRFTRLYPTYIIAVLGGVVASGFTVPARTIFQHLFFLQGSFFPVIYENNPLWSLQYEVIFYLLFIPLSILNARPWLVAAVAGLSGIVLQLLMPSGVLGELSQYLIGFSFWAFGWTFSRFQVSPNTISWPRLASALLLLLSIEYLNPLAKVINKLLAIFAVHQGVSVVAWYKSIIKLADYAALPYASFIVLRIAGARGRLLNVFFIVLQLLPAYGIFYAARHLAEPDTAEFLLPVLFYTASMLLYFANYESVTRFSQRLFEFLIPFGTISYGLYVIHFPILVLFHKVSFFSGNPFSFVTRAVIYLLFCLAAAYILDKKFQPWIKAKLDLASR